MLPDMMLMSLCLLVLPRVSFVSVQSEFYGKEVIEADREMVETMSDLILRNAADEDVSFLVVGDPFGAATHMDLLLRAKDAGIPTRVIHNASIMNAVACTGLQLYNFGLTVSMCFWEDDWKPTSFYEKLAQNKQHNLHTLCLLDIKVKDPTPDSIMKKKRSYLPPRFMTVAQAAQQILDIEAMTQAGVCTPNTRVIGVARVGAPNQLLVRGTLQEMVSVDMGEPLHSMIIPGDELHFLEEDAVQAFCLAASELSSSSCKE